MEFVHEVAQSFLIIELRVHSVKYYPPRNSVVKN